MGQIISNEHNDLAVGEQTLRNTGQKNLTDEQIDLMVGENRIYVKHLRDKGENVTPERIAYFISLIKLVDNSK